MHFLLLLSPPNPLETVNSSFEFEVSLSLFFYYYVEFVLEIIRKEKKKEEEEQEGEQRHHMLCGDKVTDPVFSHSSALSG